MRKYNKSEVMKKAWGIYRMAQKWVNKLSFSECLKRAWAEVKKVAEQAIEAVNKGIVRMHYAEYKKSFASCATVSGSYDKRTKTIEVMTKSIKSALCPICRTYCYGDCCAH